MKQINYYFISSHYFAIAMQIHGTLFCVNVEAAAAASVLYALSFSKMYCFRDIIEIDITLMLSPIICSVSRQPGILALWRTMSCSSNKPTSR